MLGRFQISDFGSQKKKRKMVISSALRFPLHVGSPTRGARPVFEPLEAKSRRGLVAV